LDKAWRRAGRIEWADLEIECMGQNLYLEAAALEMGSRIIANIKPADVTKIFGLKESHILRKCFYSICKS